LSVEKSGYDHVKLAIQRKIYYDIENNLKKVYFKQEDGFLENCLGNLSFKTILEVGL